MYKIIFLTCALLLCFSSFTPLPSSAAESTTVDKEALFWEGVTDDNDVEGLELYLQKYPKGEFAELAQLRINRLKGTGNSGSTRQQTPTAATVTNSQSPSQQKATKTLAAKDEITDLAYSVQDDNSIYFTGKYQDKPVNLVREGVIGSGKWTIYTGTPADRVRLIIDDTKGLQEILAMDKGQRITVNLVGQERIEYRIYDADRRFIVGSVIYQENKNWLQGTMKTEAFPGYPALINVSDVTKDIAAQVAPPRTTLVSWLEEGWRGLHFVSTAHASSDDILENTFKEDRAKLDEMADSAKRFMRKATLAGVGTLLLTNKTAQQLAVGTVEFLFIPEVALGIALGYVAHRAIDKFSEWKSARNVGSGTDAEDAVNKFNELTRRTKFTDQEPPAVLSQQTSSPSPSEIREHEEEIRLNQQKEDFRKEMAMAESCTTKRDYHCAESHLFTAGILANNRYDDNKLIEAARAAISAKKQLDLQEKAAEQVIEKQDTLAKPVISDVTPTRATKNQMTTFTVKGTNLIDKMMFNLEGCGKISELPGGTSTVRKFSCMPTVAQPVTGLIKDQPGSNGILLYDLHVLVVNPNSNVVPAPEGTKKNDESASSSCNNDSGLIGVWYTPNASSANHPLSMTFTENTYTYRNPLVPCIVIATYTACNGSLSYKVTDNDCGGGTGASGTLKYSISGDSLNWSGTVFHK